MIKMAFIASWLKTQKFFFQNELPEIRVTAAINFPKTLENMTNLVEAISSTILLQMMNPKNMGDHLTSSLTPPAG